MKKKILIVFGTRPEAIKMAPLVKTFKSNPTEFIVKICVTAQHRQMLDQVLDFFEIDTDYDLDLMKDGQNLYQLTADILNGLKIVLEDFKPNYVFVHGDTTTSMAAALSAFYFGSKVCHVEAGLRTYNKLSPFPEEINRQLTGRLSDFHFSPTEVSKNNLLIEGVPEENILVTGNTVIDALMLGLDRLLFFSNLEIEMLSKTIDVSKKIILVTGHRRENHGSGFENICEALKKIATIHNDVQIIYPVHLNPNVKNVVYSYLGGHDRIVLVNPLGYPAFLWLMKASYLILTDSGGIQEEAPSLGKPVLVMRDTTERPEAISSGTVKLVGTNVGEIVEQVGKLVLNEEIYKEMQGIKNPYGTGQASNIIVDFLKTLD